jgi:hypothetical protein
MIGALIGIVEGLSVSPGFRSETSGLGCFYAWRPFGTLAVDLLRDLGNERVSEKTDGFLTGA